MTQSKICPSEKCRKFCFCEKWQFWTRPDEQTFIELANYLDIRWRHAPGTTQAKVLPKYISYVSSHVWKDCRHYFWHFRPDTDEINPRIIKHQFPCFRRAPLNNWNLKYFVFTNDLFLDYWFCNLRVEQKSSSFL